MSERKGWPVIEEMKKMLVVIAMMMGVVVSAMAQRIVEFDGSLVRLETGQWVDVSHVPYMGAMRAGHNLQTEIARCQRMAAEERWRNDQRDMAELSAMPAGGYGGYSGYSVNVGGVMVSGGYGQTTIGVATKHGGAMVSLPSSVFNKQKKADAKKAAARYAEKRSANAKAKAQPAAKTVSVQSLKNASASQQKQTTNTTPANKNLLVW